MNVMLSYRRSTEGDFVKEFASSFQEVAGRILWIDREGIKPGQKWRDELLRELSSCDACIPVLSPGYLESEHCRMEVFIARSQGKPIYPIMVGDSFAALKAYEETKGLEDIFMILWHRMSAVGLPITKEDAIRRIADAVLKRVQPAPKMRPVYISYMPRNAELATALAKELTANGIATWVATLDTRVGENWRDAQARALMSACAQVVVLDEGITGQKILRTEILLGEAQGLEVLTVVPPHLAGEQQKIGQIMDALDDSDQTYRRLTAVQAYPCTSGVSALAADLAPRLRELVGSGR